MKKVLIIIIFICTQLSAFAIPTVTTNGLWCKNGQAWNVTIVQTLNVLYGTWEITSVTVTAAGGCAGGDWYILYGIVQPGGGDGRQTDAALAAQLNSDLDLNGPYPLDYYPELLDIEELQNWQPGDELPSCFISDGTMVWLNPDDLDDDVLAWLLDHGQEYQRISVSENDNNSLPEFDVYPNPAKDEVKVKLADFSASNSSFEIEIINRLGQTIQKALITFSEGNLEKAINVSELSQGIYAIRLRNDNQESIKRFIKN